MGSTIFYKKNEYFTLKADFYGTSRNHAPVILYIHGGGLLWGTREEISEEMMALYTQNGFSLFSIDYRLAPETKLPAILEDVQDALSWVENEGPKHFSINPKRMAVVGSSAGGFLALCTGMFKNKPSAIVSFYGYGDISAKWATTPNKFYCNKDTVPKEVARSLVSDKIITEGTVNDRFLLYLYARQTGEWIQEVTGINPTMNQKELIALSPIHNINGDYPPTLLLHGTNDVDVPYEQSVFMRAALLNNKIKTKLITIPNGEHVFEKDFHNPNVQSALSQVIEFLHEHLDQ
ncbi:alpha/beta hydrolase [Schinkia azotoformans]|nr:alpha/beta hydrolase [Schinkia azotoformans]MEC1717298.1 alpha/beta hydrolase [Schinkia azotoformans]MEC1739322.1 alpha/beta hydrolase [Schinkia azotoformans]MEC1747664.1 alpha/beta hydrolase [Schinkia azotoformans]MEC1760191.1 alpha/beta hydrolase [Schinkia azotoformans]MEC1764975.1 alpha/beta hydrolase [Schinkia azotoformans]